MRRQEILWRDPELVSMADEFAGRAMAQFIKEANDLLNEVLDPTDPKYKTKMEARDRALAQKASTMKAFQALALKPVSEEDDLAAKADAESAKLLEAVRANRPEPSDLSRFTPDTAEFAKKKPDEAE